MYPSAWLGLPVNNTIHNLLVEMWVSHLCLDWFKTEILWISPSHIAGIIVIYDLLHGLKFDLF
jgi:hypothetical protein